MSVVVWKFVLAAENTQSIRMPRAARLLHVANQYEAPCLWAAVDPETPPVMRCILMVGTGQEVDLIHPFVGTILMEYGSLVLHVFDGGETPPSGHPAP